MKTTLTIVGLALASTLLLNWVSESAHHWNWTTQLVIALSYVGAFFIGWQFLIFLDWAFWNLTSQLAPARSEFLEPDSDPVITTDLGPLIECDTAGVPTPPSEVNVYEYLWNPALSAYELSQVTPLSEYHHAARDPELAQILTSSRPPAIIPGAPVPEGESEFDEIERRLSAPAFQDRAELGR